ncbi:hypothetical protein FIBSPDRAFT_904029 [Athelia psychrophila]|uniref:Uncharacterized protein n=1 Tax=Athelia psychrophila TaxID=1759441 RepID=A0A167V8X1_9AGAM|nr:hypothetical protein FIBSPDRAFT_904029 [Fibularhizoctonia sp. CBS 109695]
MEGARDILLWFHGVPLLSLNASSTTATRDHAQATRPWRTRTWNFKYDKGSLQPHFELLEGTLLDCNEPGLNLELVKNSLLGGSDGIATWLPHVHGKFLKDDPEELVLESSVGKIPLSLVRNCDDEDTLFSLDQTNVTFPRRTDADFREWVRDYFPNATVAEIDLILQSYPSDPALGSPFGTGDNNTLYPQYKRIAAFQGDDIFQALVASSFRPSSKTRGPFLTKYRSGDKRDKTSYPVRNTHQTDLLSMYGTGNGTELPRLHHQLFLPNRFKRTYDSRMAAV